MAWELLRYCCACLHHQRHRFYLRSHLFRVVLCDEMVHLNLKGRIRIASIFFVVCIRWFQKRKGLTKHKFREIRRCLFEYHEPCSLSAHVPSTFFLYQIILCTIIPFHYISLLFHSLRFLPFPPPLFPIRILSLCY